MATNTNEFNTWQYLTPVVNMPPDNEFNVWNMLTPDEDIDEGAAAAAAIRRRVFEF